MPRVTDISPRNLPADFDTLVRMHPPCAIHDETAYGNVQEVVDALTCLPKLTRGQKDYLDTLTILMEAYEDEHHAIDASSVGPLEALRYLMEEHGMNASTLGTLLGERSLGSKILTGQRNLSKAHVRKLAEHFRVSADLFL